MITIKNLYLFCIIFLYSFYSCHSPLQAQATKGFKAVVVAQNGQMSLADSKKSTELPKLYEANSDYFIQESNYVVGSLAFGEKILLWQRHRGITIFENNLKDLKKVQGLLERKVVFDQEAVREVTAISSDLSFLCHKHDVLIKKDDTTYEKIEHSLSKTNYLTMIEKIGDYVYLGTGLNGLYRGKVNNKKLVLERFSTGLPYIPHTDNLFFYEEIGAIAALPDSSLLVGTNIQGSLFLRAKGDNKFVKISWPYAPDTLIDVYQISVSVKSSKVWISTSKGLIIKGVEDLLATKKIEEKDFSAYSSLFTKPIASLQFAAFFDENDSALYGYFVGKKNPTNERKQKLKAQIQNKEAFYSSAYNYKTKTAQVDAMLSREHFNAIVLDLKDDFGYVRYQSEIEFVKSIGALRPMLNLREFVAKTKSKNKYIIARVVVFQDPVLYNVKGYALRDRYSGGVWTGNGKEKWVDAFNPDIVSKYYVPLVKELQKFGVDEIQLDYIRFPSDGPIYKIKSDYNKHEQIYHSEALENFLYQIHAAIDIPLGVDIYGYNGLYRSPGVIGQDIEAFGRHVEVVGPMLYSSHFGNRYMTNRPREKRAFDLMKHSALRYNYLAQDDYLVRPYLQGFNMLSALWGGGEVYYADQIKGTEAAGGKGFMFWGPFVELLKVENAIKKLRSSH